MTAERYQMADLRVVCESMLIVTASNWADVLKTGVRVRSTRLMLEVQLFLRDHLTLLTKEVR